MEQTRFLVIGGGVTGLSFAGHLEGQQYLLCEAADELGGYCRTVHQDGFTWDYSGHFFHFRNPEIEAELVSHIGRDRVRTVQRDSRIFYAGELIDFPFQRNIHQLPQGEFLECLADLVERPTDAQENFQQMLYTRYGRGICDKFLIPYNEKLYATGLDRLDVDAMGRFFPHASVADILTGLSKDTRSTYNATFTYPEGGAMDYVRALASRVDQDRVFLERPITRLDLKTHTAHSQRGPIRFEYVLSSLPFPSLLQLCGVPFSPEVYSHNKVLVFNLGFDSKGPEGIHWIYYPQRDISFYRVGFYDNIFEQPRMSIYVELGYEAGAVLDAAAVAQAKQRVLRDLQRCNVVTTQKLVSSHHVVLDPAYVHITREANQDVAEKRALLAARGVYSAGRYGSWTYCSIEDNIIEARGHAARFNALASAGAL